MISPVSSATQPQAAAQTNAASAPVQPKAQPTAIATDTVQISAAAKALQEAIETPAQTAKEAAGGDVQARHLLAKQAAQKANG
jgi:hypothetical protein